MIPFDEFVSKVSHRVTETDTEQNLVPLMLATGDAAKMYISRIYQDGAETVLDEILRDAPDTRGPGYTPDETTHNKIQVDDHVIYWSKSGVDPFVGVYQVGHDQVNVQRQDTVGDEMMDEDRIKNIDREAVEAASHFLLRGFDEGTIGRVVDDACTKCYETEEALTMMRDLISEDPRLSAYALDEDEEGMFSDYRHSLRKKLLGHQDVVDPAMYELDMGGDLLGEPAAPQVDPRVQTEIAELQAEIAEKEAEHAEEMERLKSELQDLQGKAGNELTEKDDVNKGSQTAGFRHEAGPQALANAISQMEWTGPGSQFDLFLNEITVDGYNMLGSAASGAAQQQPEQPEQPQPEMGAAPETQAAAPTPEPEQPDDVDLGAL